METGRRTEGPVKRLLLIAPVAPRSLLGEGFHFRLPCLSLMRVAALTPSGWSVRIVDERVEPIDWEAEADLVGITAMTCTAPRAYAIADRYRRRGIPVVLGGIHATSLPEEALPHCDSVVVGEAEGLWGQVLRDAAAGELRARYWHAEGLPTLANLPVLDWGQHRSKGYLPVHFVETTRGCPLDCEFCAVTTFFGGRYRSRPVSEVFKELEGLQPFEGNIIRNAVFFVDDNLVGNRGYARELLRGIEGMGLNWFGHASVNIAGDAELLDLCRRSGCVALLIGFETLSAETMRSIGRKSRLRIEYLDAIQRIHDHGIGIDGSFVFGFDTDDEGVFDRTLEFVTRAKIEVPYFSILTPYPGTRLYGRLREEDRILETDWTLYDTSDVVIRPKRMSPETLLEGYLRVYREAYAKECVAARLRGSRSSLSFFVPANFAFREGVKELERGLASEGTAGIAACTGTGQG